MGTLTGQNIIDRAWIKAQDTVGGTGVRWPSTEAILWINDGQREVVNQLPKSYTKSATPALVAGTRQSLSGLSLSDGIAVIDVVKNVTGGRAITKRDRAWFDEQRPTWHSETGATVFHWTYDERDPKSFYVYPASSGAQVELIYAASPADLATLASVITLDDIYANALQWFVLFSFYSKDAVYTKSPQLASQYWGLFMQSLGFRDKAVVMADQVGDKQAAGV